MTRIVQIYLPYLPLLAVLTLVQLAEKLGDTMLSIQYSLFGEYQYSVFSKLWCKFGVKLAADKMFSIRAADDSEKVNSQTSRGKPGIPARKDKKTKIKK